MSVILTDEEAERIESTAQDRGLSIDDVLHEAVAAFLNGNEPVIPDPNWPLRASAIERSRATIVLGRGGYRFVVPALFNSEVLHLIGRDLGPSIEARFLADR